jgi:hypothetical protein
MSHWMRDAACEMLDARRLDARPRHARHAALMVTAPRPLDAVQGVPCRSETNLCDDSGKRRSAAGFPFIFFYHAVFDVDDAMRILGDIVLMRYQHDGISLRLQAIEDGHNFVSRL